MQAVRKDKIRLNPEECLRAWVQAGSRDAAYEILKQKYPGGTFKRDSVRLSAMRFVVHEPVKAREIVVGQNPDVINDSKNDAAWDSYLIYNAVLIFKFSTPRKRSIWAHRTSSAAFPGKNIAKAYPEFCTLWYGDVGAWEEFMYDLERARNFGSLDLT